ncbi:amino-acid N-acetyltransferase [Solimonas marina]|uniref:Amino-acid acetyltransferase n=1 Tax=Solimonas marina TaxID=2714601 RepID=A0A969W9C7_9GAMM|nr:amino-acid N-acetyltransferase [Solimonas marina]NKF22393.1 amino-acid N-acetyltransferase [Solimonas marina]
MEPTDFVSVLRGCAPYVHAHNGRVFVIAFGGEAAERADFDSLIYDIALLHSLGVKLVLVHGIRPQIDAKLQAQGLTAQLVDNVRVTDRAALECVKAAAGSVRMDIEARLSTSLVSTPMGGSRLRVSGGNWITAKPVGVRHGVDHQFTGEVRRVDTETIRHVLEQDRIALLSPIGYSPTGETFNLRAEDLATAVAVAMEADKLVFVTPTNPEQWPIADNTGDAGQLSWAEGERLLDGDSLSTLDRGYLQAALAATRGGVKRVHLVGHEDGALLRELYTRDGVGLMLYSDADYEATRDATIEDVGGVMALIQPLERNNVLVPRSREQLELDIQHFNVIVRDGLVIACCALFPFPQNGMGELACVAVHPGYQRAGHAAALLKRVEAEARSLGLTKLFSLTTHTPHWFIEHGFRKAGPDELPAQKQRLYNFQRNSLVLVKDL